MKVHRSSWFVGVHLISLRGFQLERTLTFGPRIIDDPARPEAPGRSYGDARLVIEADPADVDPRAVTAAGSAVPPPGAPTRLGESAGVGGGPQRRLAGAGLAAAAGLASAVSVSPPAIRIAATLECLISCIRDMSVIASSSLSLNGRVPRSRSPLPCGSL